MDDEGQRREDQFVTPPVFPHPPDFVNDYEHGGGSTGSELHLLNTSVEGFEDDEKTPGLTLAGPAHTPEVRRHSTEKAMLEATLTNLRSKLADIEKDDWLYEGPRHSYA